MAVVFLALGSNVGDGNKHLDDAIRLLGAKISDIIQAPRYTSKAVGFTDQADFLNTVIKGRTDLKPLDLLAFTQEIEKKIGRIWRFHWGPREIDIDIIFYDYQIINEPNLTVPHPRFSEREFVLKPLSYIVPDFIDPVSKLKIKKLYDNLPTELRSITN
jgi:2-amino-4-hydroxy-6-hydroxymethyldihydropteridine diphosphokinase